MTRLSQTASRSWFLTESCKRTSFTVRRRSRCQTYVSRPPSFTTDADLHRSDQYVRFHLQCCQPGLYEVRERICSHRCWGCRLRPARVQAAERCRQPAEGRAVPISITLLSAFLTYANSYCNMDFALLSTLLPSLVAGICRILISYDVGCQWYKFLQARLDSYFGFAPFQVADLEYWKVAVPKFHLSGHGTECQVLFNLAYTKWAGRMDGERIEGGWAQTMGMATWTRESGPYARRNILDDHWNASNWGKLLGLRQFPLFPTPTLADTSFRHVSP